MSLLVALRRGTHDAHDRLEDGLDVLQRCRTREDYVRLLQALRSLYAPLEQALAACAATPSVVPDWRDRRKTAWLDSDLARLVAATPADGTVPALLSAEDVAGAAYVMEGATLGGAEVVRSLKSAGRDVPPHRFFSSYGADRGAMWSTFRRHLAGVDLDQHRTVEAARRTFGCFEQACLPGRTPVSGAVGQT